MIRKQKVYDFKKGGKIIEKHEKCKKRKKNKQIFFRLILITRSRIRQILGRKRKSSSTVDKKG